MKWLNIFRPKRTQADKKISRYIHSIFGFYPSDISLYRLAFRHRSATKNVNSSLRQSNERLEYLGDAVLGLAVADYLYKIFPDKDEGFLTKMRSKLTNRTYLNDLALRLGLDRYMEMRLGEKDISATLYGSAFEALIGALYVDKGYAKTKKFILDKTLLAQVNISEIERQDDNYKSQLIEWAQKEKKTVIFDVNEITSGSGTFIAKIFVDDELVGEGKGTSKKRAEQNAAEQACIRYSLTGNYTANGINFRIRKIQ